MKVLREVSEKTCGMTVRVFEDVERYEPIFKHVSVIKLLSDVLRNCI